VHNSLAVEVPSLFETTSFDFQFVFFTSKCTTISSSIWLLPDPLGELTALPGFLAGSGRDSEGDKENVVGGKNGEQRYRPHIKFCRENCFFFIKYVSKCH